MSKYAGQKVRFVGKTDESFTNGKIYEACDRRRGSDRVSVVVDDNGDQNGWLEEHFELVTDDTPHIVATKSEGGQMLANIQFVHPDRTSATAEAKRRAVLFPGVEFAIYARVTGYRSNPTVVEVA